jgi:hypothetical protein
MIGVYQFAETSPGKKMASADRVDESAASDDSAQKISVLRDEREIAHGLVHTADPARGRHGRPKLCHGPAIGLGCLSKDRQSGGPQPGGEAGRWHGEKRGTCFFQARDQTLKFGRVTWLWARNPAICDAALGHLLACLHGRVLEWGSPAQTLYGEGGGWHRICFQ